VAHGAEGVEFVVLELSPVSHMDAMGVAFVDELWQNYRQRGIQLVRVGVGWGMSGVGVGFVFVGGISRAGGCFCWVAVGRW
jgi:hypothetical protein